MPHIRIKIYDDNGTSGKPDNLLGQSNSFQINQTGLTYIPVSATIPADGNVYVGFETDRPVVFYLDVISGYTSYDVGHTFGPGPNPFGTANSVPSDQWEESIEYNYPNPTITLKWDGSTLTTSPSTVYTNSTGGFSGVIFAVPNSVAGLHVVNATDSVGKFATQNFNVTSSISLNVTKGLVGTHVNVSGNGFASNSALTLLFDTSHLAMTPSSPSTDSTGSFTSLAFTVPSNATAGNHTVKIIDASGNNATKSFTVQVLNISVGPVSSGQFTQTYKTSGGT